VYHGYGGKARLLLPYLELYGRHRVVVGDGVKHLNAFTYYLLGEYVHDLMVAEANIRLEPDVIRVLVHGSDALKRFVASEDPEHFFHSRNAANELIRIVESILTEIAHHQGPTPSFGPDYEKIVKGAIAHFESTLESELVDLPAFCVEVVGNLSTERLIKGASAGFPEVARKNLNDFQKREINDAGACLAYGQGTASGFHILRALESLVKDFAIKATGAPPKKRDWGHYCELLDQNGADKKVTGIMRQINDLHRKPLMHPEDVLTTDEAVSLFCICQSAIEALIGDMLSKRYLPVTAQTP
jgi:hypothetical protein